MASYIFKTTATMKEYNRRKWWIDSNIIREIRVESENIKAALQRYREIVAEKYYIDISANAIKNKSAMYVDTSDGDAKQVGYVITGKTEFEDRENYKWSTQFIDLWVSVLTVVETNFSEV